MPCTLNGVAEGINETPWNSDDVGVAQNLLWGQGQTGTVHQGQLVSALLGVSGGRSEAGGWSHPKSRSRVSVALDGAGGRHTAFTWGLGQRWLVSKNRREPGISHATFDDLL